MGESKFKRTKEEKKGSWYDANRCDFITLFHHGEKRCKFLGTYKSAPEAEKKYCDWHSEVKHDPNRLNTYSGFMEWYKKWFEYLTIHKTQYSDCPKDCEIETDHRHKVKKPEMIWYLLGNSEE